MQRIFTLVFAFALLAFSQKGISQACSVAAACPPTTEDFSDNASGTADTSSSQNPCHTFINVSNPNVMLTLTSDSGCQQTFTAPVIFHPMPVPDFASPTSCFGSQTCFVNATSVSSGSIAASQWYFGDVTKLIPSRTDLNGHESSATG